MIAPSQFITAFLAFLLIGVLLATYLVGWVGLEIPESRVPRRLSLLVFGAVVALAGYFAFWIYFVSPAWGKAFSVLMLAAGLALAVRTVRRAKGRWRSCFPDDVLIPAILAGIIGIGYIGLLYAYGGAKFFSVAAERFTWTLPYDNEIPTMFASRLWDGVSPKRLTAEWLSSDRPPLQAGWSLLFRPFLAPFFDGDTIGAVAGVWFQLLWVPAIWGLVRTFGTGVTKATSIVSAVTFSGVILINTTFTWPKLSSASFLVGAFLFCFSQNSPKARDVFPFVAGGLLAALGFLSHGGVAFSLLGVIPLVAFQCIRDRSQLRGWLLAGLVFALMSAPWLAYQRFYAPPANHLLKWHLAGQAEHQDENVGFLSVLNDQYRSIGWATAWSYRVANFRTLSGGHYLLVGNPWHPEFRKWSSGWEFFATTGSFGFWLLSLAALPWVIWKQRGSHSIVGPIVVWVVLGIGVWLSLLFLPQSAIVHQGSYVTQVVGLALLTWIAMRIHPLFFLSIATLQIIVFLIVWVPAREGRPDTLDIFPSAIFGLATLGLAAINLWRWFAPEEPEPVAIPEI